MSALFLQIHTVTKKAMGSEILTMGFQRSFIEAFPASYGEESLFVLLL